MNKIKHPSYDLYLRTSKCKYELFIDDILIYTSKPHDESFGTGTGVEIPLNNSILKNGKHDIKLRLLPWISKKNIDNESYAEFNVYITDTDNIYFSKKNQLENIDVLKIETPWGGLDKNINYPFYELKGEFEATILPFELIGWTKSVNLAEEDEKKLFKEVVAHYQELHAILKKRDAVKWDKLHQEKEALMSKAFYYDYHVNEKKDPMYIAMTTGRKNATTELFKEEGLELVSLNPTNLKLLIQANGTLVSLVRHDNTAALRFNDPKNKGEIEFEVRLHRKQKGDKLSII